MRWRGGKGRKIGKGGAFCNGVKAVKHREREREREILGLDLCSENQAGFLLRELLGLWESK